MITRDEIIKMARGAGINGPAPARQGFKMYANPHRLERFAALVEKHLIASGYRKCAVGQRTTQFCGQLEQAVLAEREACASMAEAFYHHQYDFTGNLELHEAIRARSEK